MKYLAFLIILLSATVYAAENSFRLDKAQTRITDIESLKRGALFYAQNCLSCHSAKFMRYSRIGQDLGWTNEELRANIMLQGGGIYDPMISALTEAAALEAYGVVPPDLSLQARIHTTHWLLSYLKGFYRDPESASSFNNVILKNTAMPNILAPLQGIQEAVYSEVHGEKQLTGLTLAIPGRLNKKEFHNQMTDLINFLDYMSEPAKLKRVQLGWKVLLFIFILIVLAYLVKREYWKDIS